jgi:iron complex outermembrane recepter protein
MDMVEPPFPNPASVTISDRTEAVIADHPRQANPSSILGILWKTVKQRSSHKKKNREAIAAILGLFNLGQLAFAQTPSANDQSAAVTPAGGAERRPLTLAQAIAPPEELPGMTVTGYVIPPLGEGTQPVFTLDRDWWQRRGEQSMAQVLESLPLATGNFNQNFATGNNTSPGSDAVNLRNLGVNATLVLVDGLRFPLFPLPLNFVQTFVDLNSIPMAAVDRIEILKDSGTATYGDDAVGGVVNIILKDSYNGAQISNYLGFSQRGDDVTYHSQFLAGIAEDLGRLGKVNIVTAFDYEASTPINALDRPLTTTDYSELSPKYPTSSAPFGYLSSFLGLNSGNFYTVIPGTKTGPTTSLTTEPISSLIFVPRHAELQPREERWGGLLKVNYSPVEWFKLYDTWIIQDNHETASTLNQGYDFGGADKVFGQPVVIPTSNPFNTSGEPLVPQGGWGGDFPSWIQETWTRTFRNTAGALVQLPDNWTIEGVFNYGESDGTITTHNVVNLLKLQEALSGTLPGHGGQFYNPFLDWRAVQGFNGALSSAILTDQWLDSRSDLTQSVLKTGGTVLDLWSGPLNVAGGLEYRSESLIESNDQLSELRLIGNGSFLGKQTSGRRYIKSGYWEVDLPLAGDKWSWPGLRALDLTYSERLDVYTVFGSATKPKFAVRYKPFDDLTIRATYSESFVVPSLSQLFATPLEFGESIIDPQFPVGDPRHSYSTLLVQGSNAALKAQQAYSYYLEGVWSPDSRNEPSSWLHWLHGFTAYFDWFQVELRNQIGTIPSQFVVDAPAGFPGNDVIRSPATGQITRIDNPFINIGTLNTRGFDFGLSYVTREYDWGKFDFELNGTYVYGYSEKIPYPPLNGRPRFQVITMDDQAGGGGVGFGGGPDFKLVASLFYSKTVWDIDKFSTGFSLNYRDSEADFNNNAKGSNPLANPGLDAPNYVHLIGSWTTLDYQLSYEFGKPEEITLKTAMPGYDKEGNRLLGEQAISPKPEGPRWGWRSLLNNMKFIFGINNIFDAHQPLSIDGFLGRDVFNDNSIQRFFYFEIDKRF